MNPSLLSPNARRIHARNRIVLFILGVLILIVFIISMNTGLIRISPLALLQTLLGGGTEQQQMVLFDFRLPRIVIALLVGAGLAVSGCIMQSLSHNALADPGILGVNAGASLVVVLFISFYPATALAPIFFLPFLALLGAGSVAVIIYRMSYKRHEGLVPTRLLLIGIAVAAGINSITMVLTLRMSPENYQFVATWIAGSIWGSNWKFVLALLPWIVVLLPYAYYHARTLNVLQLGDHLAVGLGVPLERKRLILLGIAVGLAGACVAVSGGIGFVGLIGPHLARRLVGPKHEILLPASALAGGLLLITADTVARMIMPASEIPTGIVVAVIGAPYFLYLLARSKM
ncbi:MAG: iron ABC transporter permease [Gorillibacterium sp.]|nr:iron ABC transporter permease [Gorillibacterium sp.]